MYTRINIDDYRLTKYIIKIVLYVCTSLYFWYNDFSTVGKRLLLNLYIIIPIRSITTLSIVNILGSLNIGPV